MVPDLVRVGYSVLLRSNGPHRRELFCPELTSASLRGSFVQMREMHSQWGSWELLSLMCRLGYKTRAQKHCPVLSATWNTEAGGCLLGYSVCSRPTWAT